MKANFNEKISETLSLRIKNMKYNYSYHSWPAINQRFMDYNFRQPHINCNKFGINFKCQSKS